MWSNTDEGKVFIYLLKSNAEKYRIYRMEHHYKVKNFVLLSPI